MRCGITGCVLVETEASTIFSRSNPVNTPGVLEGLRGSTPKASAPAEFLATQAFDDSIEVVRFDQAAVSIFPAPAAARHLAPRPNSLELWGLTPFISPGPSWVHKFDLDAGTTTSIPVDATFGFPNMSLDVRLFIATNFVTDSLVIADTQTRGVYVQG